MESHVYLHLLVQSIVHNQAVRHAYPVRLHRVTRYVGIVSNIRVVEVSDLLVGSADAIRERFNGHPWRLNDASRASFRGGLSVGLSVERSEGDSWFAVRGGPCEAGWSGHGRGKALKYQAPP